MNKWTTQSFAGVFNRGHCHLCGAEYKDGWLDREANETCNDCKSSMDEPDDQELLDFLVGAVCNEDIVSILTRLDFPIFEIKEGFFDA